MTVKQSRAISILGWAATATAVLMYLSYLDQIALNLAGAKGSRILPLATMLNCGLWMAYGALKPQRDWPLLVANLPGVILGAIALITAL